MSEDFRQKLIIISGSPCVSKTSVATSLFESYVNCTYGTRLNKVSIGFLASLPAAVINLTGI